MKCFYHNADHDGMASAFIVTRFHPEAKLIGINYGDPFPWEIIERGEIVYMVDFSLQPASYMFLLDAHLRLGDGRLAWIDHHVSAMRDCDTLIREIGMREIDGIRSKKHAACRLVWNYFKIGNKPAPKFIKLISYYDTWQHEKHPDVLAFEYGLRALDTHPSNTQLWESLFDDKIVQRIIDNGWIILDYVNRENDIYAKATAFKTELDGHEAIAINRQISNSKTFDAIPGIKNVPLQIMFGYRKGGWKVSLYSLGNQLDVSTIAKNHGGGGHAGAAGFQCKVLPFALGAI